MIAMHRRMRDEGVAALQFYREDILPLVLLFAVSLTGLLLTVSSTWLRGYGYEFMSLTHAVTVIVTLFWLPFGKFFHIFQHPHRSGSVFTRMWREPKSLQNVGKFARAGLPRRPCRGSVWKSREVKPDEFYPSGGKAFVS